MPGSFSTDFEQQTKDLFHMLPVIALVGRPNVGKSTLFNALTRSRDALVSELPGLTRDRQHGYGRLGDKPFIVADTGGLTDEQDGIESLMANQTLRALDEADTVLFMVDARDGLTHQDELVADAVRRSGKPTILVVNKAEGQTPEIVSADFFALGFSDAAVISATHGDNVRGLIDQALSRFDTAASPAEKPGDAVRVAVIGRPNVGKSTLVNRLVGDERVLTFDQPGTTRDSIEVPFECEGRNYILIDTAGIRRRARVREKIEKFSVIKALQAIDQSNVILLMLDATTGISEQDASLAGLVIERGRAMVVAVNKWDRLSSDAREEVKRQLDLKLRFLEFAPLHFVSALKGTNVDRLLAAVDRGYQSAFMDLPTSALNRVLEDAVARHQPPIARGRRIRLRYAHQGGRNPPVIVIHGSQIDRLPGSYKRYLSNRFRQAFDLEATPVRIELRSGANPYLRR